MLDDDTAVIAAAIAEEGGGEPLEPIEVLFNVSSESSWGSVMIVPMASESAMTEFHARGGFSAVLADFEGWSVSGDPLGEPTAPGACEWYSFSGVSVSEFAEAGTFASLCGEGASLRLYSAPGSGITIRIVGLAEGKTFVDLPDGIVTTGWEGEWDWTEVLEELPNPIALPGGSEQVGPEPETDPEP